MRRLPVFASVGLLTAALVLLSACGKKAPPVLPGDPAAAGPAVAASEFVVFAHVNGKDILASELFAEIKKAFVGEGAKAWDSLEKEGQAGLGVKPTDLASLSLYVTEVPERAEPKFVGILTADKPFDRVAMFKSMNIANTEPDGRGFYTPRGGPGLLHFADDKTAVMLHPELADKYLGGFGKDRATWPVSADLTAAATGHALFAAVNLEKLPAEVRNNRDAQQFAPLLAAKTATLTLDLKGKALELGVRAAYPDAAAAGKAKDLVTQFLPLAQFFVDGAASGDGARKDPALPAMKAAQKTLKEAKIEATGADLTVSLNYAADFDIAAAVAGAFKKVGVASERMTSSNNLKQLGLSLHNYASADARQHLPIYAIGKGGQPLRNQTDAPLLSWRVAILPYIEQENLYQQFKLDEPWDSAHNKKLIPLMPKTFAAPGDTGAKPGFTRYQMVIGKAAMPAKAMGVTDLTDGTSNTLAVVEAAVAVEWTKPADIMTGDKLPTDFRKKFGGLFPGGFNAVFWDGSVRFLDAATPDQTLRAMLTPNGGEVIAPPSRK